MHSIIFQICKSNQIISNYKRTSATTATKQVCWPHSHKPQKHCCQTSLKWNTGHLAETPVEIKGVFSSPLPVYSFLPSLLSQIAFLCNAPFSVCRQEQCPRRKQCCAPSNTAPEALQHWGASSSPCWMSGAPKIQKSPIQRHLKLPGQPSMGAPWSTILPFDIFTLLF